MSQFRPSGKQTLGRERGGVEEIYWEVKPAEDKGEIKTKGRIQQRNLIQF